MNIIKLASIAVLIVVSHAAQAVSIQWHFTNSGQTWSTTDTLVMHARLTNVDTVSLVLGDPENPVGGSSGLGYGPDVTANYNFNWVYDQNLYPPSGIVEILPGESIDFIFGEFVPISQASPGTYQLVEAYMSFDGPVAYSDNLFSATVVPLPSTLGLMTFGTGLIGLGMRRRKACRAEAAHGAIS